MKLLATTAKRSPPVLWSDLNVENTIMNNRSSPSLSLSTPDGAARPNRPSAFLFFFFWRDVSRMTSPSSWSLSGPSLPACLPPKSSSDVGMRTMQRAINSSQLLSLFLCLRGPSGPARPGSRDGRRVEVSIWCVCVCLVEEGGGGVVVMGAHRAANQTPLGKKNQLPGAQVTIKTS